MTSRTGTKGRNLAAVLAAAVAVSGVVTWVGRSVPTVEAAATASGTITGGGYTASPRSGVFRDIDADGTWDDGEPGQADITVTASCIADDGTDASSFDDTYVTASTTTAADGSFTLTGANVRGLCRVEFAIPTAMQTFLQPGVASTAVAAPNSAGSFVQFVDSTLDPTVTTSVNNPNEYTNSSADPQLVVGRNHTGTTNSFFNPDAATFDTVYTLDYDGTGLTGEAQAEDTGSIWGIAYHPATDTIFTSAIIKRHAGMGPGGPDAIYAIGSSVPTGWATPFTAVDTDGGAIGSNFARGLGDDSAPSDDDDAFTQAGKLSWGDLDISEDGTTLYAVNLMTKTVQPIDIGTKTAGTALTIPDPGCTNGVSRPWGLDIHDGLIYAGVVCDASTGTTADLAAFVYAYNPTTVTLPLAGVPAGLPAGTWSTNLIEEATPGAPGIQLDYTKGCTVIPFYCSWNPWDDTFSDAEFHAGPSWGWMKPQPILSDIEVDDDGSLLLAFADRAGHQFAYQNVRPQSFNQTPEVEGVIGGDILRAAVPATTGNFVLESGGTVAQGAALGGGTITGATNGEGPGGGEVYSHEQFGTFHEETGLGVLAKVPGRDEHLMGIMDPFDTDSGGIGWFPTSGAARTNAIELYDSTGTTGFGKGGGLADIEVLTEFAPVEVGNRVWRDDNANGIQDPGEPPITGVTVQMVVGSNTYSAVTDSNGDYLFSSIARTGATTVPELAAGNYRFSSADDPATIRILNATGGSQQAALADLVPTSANAGSNNDSDSDGVVNGTTVEVTLTLGALAGTNDTNATTGDSIDREGFNRHIFDFGFVPQVSLGNRVWFDTDNDSTLDPGEQPVSGVAVELFHDADANGVISGAEQTPIAHDTTDADGLYFFDQFTNPDGSPLATPRALTPGNYVVGIAASNFGATGPLEGYLSSGTTIDNAGVISEATPSDPDNDVNTDDNGSSQTSGFYAGGVLSAPISVSHAAEPTSEESGIYDNNTAAVPDDNSNLTVDFGFYTQSVGNVVWFDDGAGSGTIDNGLIDGSEAGLPGVTVLLYSGDGTTQIPVGADGVLGTADDGTTGVTTDSNGNYTFAGLPEGDYTARIVAPSGYLSSSDPTNGATPLTTDSDDNGVGTGGGTIVSNAFTLDAGNPTSGNVVNNTDGTTANTRVDFGLVLSYDLTITKTTTSSGPYVAGAPATFSLVVTNNGPGIAVDGLTVTDRLPVGLTFGTTAADGGAQWSCAAPSGQDVTCTWNGPTTGLGNDTLAAAASLPAITISAVVDDPAPVGPIVNFAVVEPSPLQTIPETVLLGTTPDKFEDGDPTTGSNNDDSKPINTVPVASLGDLVWIDDDQDGQFDQTEAPIAGVIVALLDAAGDPATDAVGNPVPATVTDGNGRYQFDDLIPGDYQVRFTLPSGYVWTASNTGNDGLDSDAIAATPDASTATTSTFTLSLTPVVDADVNANARSVTNPTIDAGVIPVVSVGDLVWVDMDEDGQFDQTEAPIAGVQVALLDAAGDPADDATGNPVPATVTDANGRYQFDNLLPSSYQVRFTLPSGYVWTTSNTGNDGLDNDAIAATPDAATATTATFTLTSTPIADADTNTNARPVTNPTIDAGIVPLLAVGDYVWHDADHDGVQDTGENPIQGMTAMLLNGDLTPATDAFGAPVPTATTDSNGHYVFDGLLPGDYVVQFGNVPTDYEYTLQGSGGGSDSNPPASGRTPVFTLDTSSGDVRPVTGSDGVTLATYIDPTIDAGVWNPTVDGSVPTTTTTTTTTVPATTTTTVPATTTTTVPAPSTPTTTTAPTTTPPTTTPVVPVVELPFTGSSVGNLLALAALALLGGFLIIATTRRRGEQ